MTGYEIVALVGLALVVAGALTGYASTRIDAGPSGRGSAFVGLVGVVLAAVGALVLLVDFVLAALA